LNGNSGIFLLRRQINPFSLSKMPSGLGFSCTGFRNAAGQTQQMLWNNCATTITKRPGRSPPGQELQALESVPYCHQRTLTNEYAAMTAEIPPWEKLLKQVRACNLCEAELPEGARPVLQLDPRARVLVAAQAPGRKVHATGLPFNDPSGERLRAWMGVTRKTFYDPSQIAIVPMGFCYPGTGRSGDAPPRPECAPAWRAQLLACLPNLELTLVIGQYSLAYHLPHPKQSLTEKVHNWHAYWPQVLPMPHPSPRNNLWLRRNPWFEQEVVPALQGRLNELVIHQ
jgi:uracil-DNA glycosylase